MLFELRNFPCGPSPTIGPPGSRRRRCRRQVGPPPANPGKQMEAQRRLQLPRPRPGSPVRKKSTAHTYARNTHRKERLPPPGADQALALKMKVTRLRCQKCGRCWSDVPVIVSDVSPHVTADLADAMAHGLMDPDSPEALSLGIALTGIFLAMLYLRSSNLHGEPSVTGGDPAAAAGRRAVPTRAATGTDARHRPCAGSGPMRNGGADVFLDRSPRDWS